jgi:ubiquinone/menaquinone biosynthesis C-methylase UbiE
MNETPNTCMAELFNAMVGAYETWAEPLSARLSQVALKRTTVSAGDRVLDIGAGTGALSLQAAALGAGVTAIDLASAMVARLNQRLAPYPECKALVMDGEARLRTALSTPPFPSCRPPCLPIGARDWTKLCESFARADG